MGSHESRTCSPKTTCSRKLYAEHGKRVVLTTLTVVNTNAHTSLSQFFGRHSRWLKMRAVVSTPGFIADLGSNPLPFATLAWLASGLDLRLLPVVAFVYAYKCTWDARLLHKLRGHGLRGAAQLWATPARDLALAGVWLYAAVSRSTVWRGRRLVLGPGSVLLHEESRLPVRLLPAPRASAPSPQLCPSRDRRRAAR